MNVVRTFGLSTLIYAALGALALGAGGGFWAGREWQQGRQAIVDVGKSAEIIALYRDERAETAREFKEASDTLAGVSRIYQEQRDASQQFYQGLRSSWDEYWRTRPDLARCVLDDAGLRLWNNANRGEVRPAAAAADPDGSAPAVPAAAGRDERRLRDAHEEPQRRDGAVRRLPQAPRAAGGRGDEARSEGS